MIQQNMAVD